MATYESRECVWLSDICIAKDHRHQQTDGSPQGPTGHFVFDLVYLTHYYDGRTLYLGRPSSGLHSAAMRRRYCAASYIYCHYYSLVRSQFVQTLSVKKRVEVERWQKPPAHHMSGVNGFVSQFQADGLDFAAHLTRMPLQAAGSASPGLFDMTGLPLMKGQIATFSSAVHTELIKPPFVAVFMRIMSRRGATDTAHFGLFTISTKKKYFHLFQLVAGLDEKGHRWSFKSICQ